MSFLADIFTGGGDVRDAANSGADQIRFQPFNIDAGGLGRLTANERGIHLGAGQLEQEFGGDLSEGARRLLGLGTATPGRPDLAQLDTALGSIQTPSALDAPGSTLTAGPFAGLQFLQQSGAGALSASDAARQALGSFDPDAFARTQFGRLESLARPGEETAASRAIGSVFARGRLGLREGGRQQELSELAFAQEQARNQRALQAIGLAGQEQDRLTGQAATFGDLGRSLVGTGEQLVQSRAAELFRQRLGGQSFLLDQGFRRGQFGRETAFGRFGAAQEALRTGREVRGMDLGSALQLLQTRQGLQQQPFQLLGPAIGAGVARTQAQTEAGNLRFEGESARAAANTEFFSGLFAAIADAIPG